MHFRAEVRARERSRRWLCASSSSELKEKSALSAVWLTGRRCLLTQGSVRGSDAAARTEHSGFVLADAVMGKIQPQKRGFFSACR